MDLGLSGKRALVLGGNRGIGFGIAAALAQEGADVAIAARDAAGLSALAEAELRKIAAKGSVTTAELDLSRTDDLCRHSLKAPDRVDLARSTFYSSNTGGRPMAAPPVGSAQDSAQRVPGHGAERDFADRRSPAGHEKREPDAGNRILTVDPRPASSSPSRFLPFPTACARRLSELVEDALG